LNFWYGDKQSDLLAFVLDEMTPRAKLSAGTALAMDLDDAEWTAI
jgi:hypothetical protein